MKTQYVHNLPMDEMEKSLSPADKKSVRLAHIFKTATNILIDDSARNPWKLACYADHILGTWIPVVIGTMVYYALSKSDIAKQSRGKIRSAANDDIDYRLYRDSMTVGDTGVVLLQKRHLAKSIGRHAIQQVFNNVNQHITRLPIKNIVRRMSERTILRNRQGRALIVVS